MKKHRAALYMAALAAIFLGAIWLRLNGLAKYPFWYDEIFTERYAPPMSNFLAGVFGISFPKFFYISVLYDFASPLYFFLIWVYGHFFTSETALRMFSVAMGMGALAMFYPVALFFLRRSEAVVAVGMMALSPFYLWYAQEARPYSTGSFLSLTAVYFFLTAIKTNKRWHWISFSCAAILAVGTNYYCLILFFLLGCFLLTKNGCLTSFRWLPFWGMAGAFCVFLLPQLLIQMGHISHGQFWLPPPDMRAVLLTPLVFTAGYLAQPLQILSGVIFCWYLWVRGMFVFWCEDRSIYILVFSCSFLSIFFIFLISRVGMPIYLDRQMIVFSPFLFICMVRAVGSIKNDLFKSGVVIFGVFFMISAVAAYDQGKIYCYNDARGDFYQGVHPKKGYKVIIARVLNDLRPGDMIITADLQSLTIVSKALFDKFVSLDMNIFIYNKRTMAPFEQAALKGFERFNYPQFPCGTRDMCGAFSFVKKSGKFENDCFGNQRVWFICSSWDFRSPLSGNVKFVKDFIAKKYKMTMVSEQDGLFVFLCYKT